MALRGAAEGELRRLRSMQAVAHSHASLTGYAYHKPGKMPRFDKVFPDPKRGGRPQSDEEMLASMRAWSRHISQGLRGRSAPPVAPKPLSENLQ